MQRGAQEEFPFKPCISQIQRAVELCPAEAQVAGNAGVGGLEVPALKLEFDGVEQSLHPQVGCGQPVSRSHAGTLQHERPIHLRAFQLQPLLKHASGQIQGPRKPRIGGIHHPLEHRPLNHHPVLNCHGDEVQVAGDEVAAVALREDPFARENPLAELSG